MVLNKLPHLLMLGAVLALPLPAMAQAAADQPGQAQTTTRATTPAYTLGAGEKLRVIVFGEENLTGEYAVSSTGIIAFPLIGDVIAGGRSLAEVQDTIRARLAAGYLNDPRVSVEVLEYRTFYILGEVNKPGEYPFRTNLTVEQAVATAGGYSYRANRKRFSISHSGSEQEQRMRFRDARGLKVAPGDTINILERFF